VVRGEPLKFTTAPETKLVPLTVSVKAPPPTFLLAGEMLVVVGGGLFTVTTCAFEEPPPGAGLATVMLNVPAVVRSLAGIAAVTLMLLAKVVVRGEPAKLTTEVDTKFVPFTVRVKAPLPRVALAGEMLVVVGPLLFTVRVCALDVPPPGAGFVTVMLNVPPVVRSLAGIAAVNCVALPKVVVRAEPLKFTTDVETKLVPFTVSVNAASPTFLLAGATLVVVGSKLFTVKVCPLDVPPPGVGLVTVMLNVPPVATSVEVMEAVN
jgi:hypothetical protein